MYNMKEQENNIVLLNETANINPHEIAVRANTSRGLEITKNGNMAEPYSDIITVDNEGYFTNWRELKRIANADGSFAKTVAINKNLPLSLKGKNILDNEDYHFFIENFADFAVKLASHNDLGYYCIQDASKFLGKNIFAGKNINTPPANIIERCAIISDTSIYDHNFNYKLKFDYQGKPYIGQARRLRIANDEMSPKNWTEKGYHYGISIKVDGQQSVEGKTDSRSKKPTQASNAGKTVDFTLFWEFDLGGSEEKVTALINLLRNKGEEGVTIEDCIAITGVKPRIMSSYGGSLRNNDTLIIGDNGEKMKNFHDVPDIEKRNISRDDFWKAAFDGPDGETHIRLTTGKKKPNGEDITVDGVLVINDDGKAFISFKDLKQKPKKLWFKEPLFEHQEHMAMVITEADIEAMVKEVVRQILEAKN